MSLQEELSQYRRVLIIHHWDTDGLCSASLLKNQLSNAKVTNRVPKIGTYQLTKPILKETSHNYDAIIVADIRLPDSDFEKLSGATNGKIVLADHHLGGTLPGVLSVREQFAAEEEKDFPATTWLIKESLHLPISLLALLGVVGDKGRLEFSDPKVREDVDRFMSELNLQETMLERISDLLDSSARIGDQDLVEASVTELAGRLEEPRALLNHPIWTRNAAILNQEIGAQMQENGELRDGVAIKRFHSKFDIVSAVARRMAWSGKYRAAVAVNSGFLDDQDQIYVRKGTGPLDSKALIQLAHEKGYSAGGKGEVVGMVVPKNDTENFLQQVLSTMVG